MKTISTIAAVFLMAGALGSSTAVAQEEEKPKFKFTPSGLLMFDGAVYGPQHDGFTDGVAVPDVRIGGKVNYGNWEAKVDLGFGYGTFSPKDIYIQYKFNDHNLLRGGWFVNQFGYQSATSSTMKPGAEAPLTDTYMAATDRNLGIMYEYDKDQFLATASIICGAEGIKASNAAKKVSLGGISRLLWRPFHATGKMLQVGVSGWYQSAPRYEITDEATGKSYQTGQFDWSCNYPSRVSKVTLLSNDMEGARSVAKISPEFMFCKDRVALEAQYYYMNVNRKDAPHYSAQGVYGQLRGILFGSDAYTYSSADGGIGTPKPKTFECVLGYNYTNANSNHAGIYGGITNDYSVTFNYYINKYLLCRLHYSYTQVWGSATVPDNHVNIIEARIQFKF